MKIMQCVYVSVVFMPVVAQADCSWVPSALDNNNYLESALSTRHLYWAISTRNIVLTSRDLRAWDVHSGLSAAEQASLNWAELVFVSSGGTSPGGGWGPRTVTSADGVNWVTSTTGSKYPLYDTTYHAGQFVVVGLWGSTLTSRNGRDWQGTSGSVGPLLNSHLFAVTSGGGQMIGVGSQGFIYAGTDGTDWTNRSSPTTEDLRDIAWSGQEYIAVGDRGTVVQSSDGTAWGAQPIDANGSPDLVRVIWNGTTFVAVTVGGSVYRSACHSMGGNFNSGGGGGLSWWALSLLALVRRRYFINTAGS